MIAIKKNELLIVIESHHDQHPRLLDKIVRCLDIRLEAPENEIVKQGSDELDAMYFVQNGDCNVIVQDKIGLEAGIKRVRTLFPGDHFGVSYKY